MVGAYIDKITESVPVRDIVCVCVVVGVSVGCDYCDVDNNDDSGNDDGGDDNHSDYTGSIHGEYSSGDNDDNINKSTCRNRWTGAFFDLPSLPCEEKKVL